MLKQIPSLNELLMESRGRSVVIFKHSATCPLSIAAYSQVERFSNSTNTDVYLLVVQADRELSNEIAEKLKLKHESPQIIILKNSVVVHHASHYDIKEEDLIKNV